MSDRAHGPSLTPELRERLNTTLASLGDVHGFVLEDIEFTRQDGQPLLRVIVDSLPAADTGLSLDEIADASREISEELDGISELSDAYLLEVTSPGADRPLTLPHHFRRNVGRLLKVTLTDGTEFTARLTQWDDPEAELTESAAKGKTLAPRRIRLNEIAHAVVEFELNRAPAQPADHSKKGE